MERDKKYPIEDWLFDVDEISVQEAREQGYREAPIEDVEGLKEDYISVRTILVGPDNTLLILKQEMIPGQPVQWGDHSWEISGER